MTYTKQQWVNGSKATPLNQTRLTHIEEGIFDAHQNGEKNANALSELDGRLGLVEDEIDKKVEITLAKRPSEVEALPEGAFYVKEPAKVGLVTTEFGHVNSPTIDLRKSAVPSKHLVIINAKTAGGVKITPPEGFEPIIDGYLVGTQMSWVFFGILESDATFTASISMMQGDGSFTDTPTNLESTYVDITLDGAVRVIVDNMFKRDGDPDLTSKVQIQGVEPLFANLTLGIACEQTIAAEVADQIIVSEGWEPIVKAFDPYISPSIVVARNAGTLEPFTVTYPNLNADNGFGVILSVEG